MITFSDDNDQLAESSGEFTGVSLTKPDKPENFTICVAYMVKAFDSRTTVVLFNLNNEDGDNVIRVYLFSQDTFTEFRITIYSLFLRLKTLQSTLQKLFEKKICQIVVSSL